MPPDPAQRIAEAAREFHAEMVAIQVLIVTSPAGAITPQHVEQVAVAAEEAAAALRVARWSLGRRRWGLWGLWGRVVADAVAWLLAAVVLALCLAYFGWWASVLSLFR